MTIPFPAVGFTVSAGSISSLSVVPALPWSPIPSVTMSSWPTGEWTEQHSINRKCYFSETNTQF